jgi:nitroreductase
MSSEILDCVETATLAPSLHNSQPWLFRVRDGGVDVYADPDRRLPVVDPYGREQRISVGAAIFTLRLALRRAGHHCRVAVFPDPAEPDLVGRVTLARREPPNRACEALAAAVTHRHTNRWPFAHVSVGPAAINRLRDAARREGAVLLTASDHSRDVVLDLARSADHWLNRRPEYRAELARWAGGEGRRDGVPRWAVGPWDSLEVVPTRAFTAYAPHRRPVEPFEPYPAVLVLATQGDAQADWVRAGQALQRVLLTATWQNLATMPISQPVEVPAVRWLLTDDGSGLAAQILLRVGYGKGVGARLGVLSGRCCGGRRGLCRVSRRSRRNGDRARYPGVGVAALVGRCGSDGGRGPQPRRARSIPARSVADFGSVRRPAQLPAHRSMAGKHASIGH